MAISDACFKILLVTLLRYYERISQKFACYPITLLRLFRTRVLKFCLLLCYAITNAFLRSLLHSYPITLLQLFRTRALKFCLLLCYAITNAFLRSLLATLYAITAISDACFKILLVNYSVTLLRTHFLEVCLLPYYAITAISDACFKILLVTLLRYYERIS